MITAVKLYYLVSYHNSSRVDKCPAADILSNVRELYAPIWDQSQVRFLLLLFVHFNSHAYMVFRVFFTKIRVRKAGLDLQFLHGGLYHA